VVAHAALAIGVPVMAQTVPPAADVETTVFLIGDAGVPGVDREPVFEALIAEASRVGSPVILFLGDNIYPAGMPAEGAADRKEGERRLSAQIDAVLQSGARGFFIPGNHDWDFGGGGSLDALLRAAAFGTARGGESVRFLPAPGCPGPTIVDLDSRLRLVLLDTQWWLFDGGVQTPAECPTRSRREVLDSLGHAVSSAGERRVVVAGHHPLESGGVHGGQFSFRQHVFPLTEFLSWAWIPLPGVGSAYPVARKMGISNQDLSGPRNRVMRAALDSVFRTHRPLVYAAGHEHTLQLISGDGVGYHVVSGTGNWGHTEPVERLTETLFAASRGGYMRLDVQRDGTVRLGIMVASRRGSAREVYSLLLDN
jgi:hypothetical protein